MTKTRNKGLITDKDKQNGLAEKRGVEVGTLYTAKDKQGLAEKKEINLGSILGKNESFFTKEDKKGLMQIVVAA